ncbi:MAG: MarR family winged helix-turn-helix transcriptional regulator [Lapillicoccus sp.]
MTHPVTPETAESISNTLVRVMKIVGSMKSHMPVTSLAPMPGLDYSHFPTLFTLGHEPRRVSALAELIHSDISTVSRQVSHLVQIGLVEKIGDPDDGRAQLLSLSPTGRQVIDDLVKRRGEWFELLLKDWKEEDAVAFLGFLTRFGDDVETFKLDLTNPLPGAHPAASQHDSPQLAPVTVAAGHPNHQNQEH